MNTTKFEVGQSVEEAIERIKWYFEEDDGISAEDITKEAVNMAIEALSERTGEWTKATGMMPPEFHGHHCCSECGNFANMEPPFGNREDLSKFCPNCGARMKGADDE